MTTMSNADSWRVTGTAQATDVSPQGSFVEGLRVTFTTGRGETGTVFLPIAAASPENVAAAISARVQIMDGIAGLTGNGG